MFEIILLCFKTLNRKIKTHLVSQHEVEDMKWLGLLLDLSCEVIFLFSFLFFSYLISFFNEFFEKKFLFFQKRDMNQQTNLWDKHMKALTRGIHCMIFVFKNLECYPVDFYLMEGVGFKMVSWIFSLFPSFLFFSFFTFSTSNQIQ